MKRFRVDALAQIEFEDAAAWYETQRDGLGLEFIDAVDRVLMRIAQDDDFPTAPIAQLSGAVVRRAFVERFPYIVIFVETTDQRRVIMIRRGSADPARWRTRL